MSNAPSTIYIVLHCSGRSVEIEVADKAMRYAKSGEENYQRMISIAFHDAIKEKRRQDPGWIKFADLEFDVIRTVRAVKPDFSGCDCACAYCDIGGHCHNKNRSCYI